MEKMPTFRVVKDYLMSTVDRKPTGKVPAGAQQNVWMALMPPPSDNYNEVYPSIVLGDYVIAKDPEKLKAQGVTHVVNCACGVKFNMINTDQQYFEDSGIKFHGIAATDIMTFKMASHFEAAADFIHNALNSGGKVYVHCMSGVSRSSAIVLAFLLMKRNMQLIDAIKAVRDKRNILPNDGFLKELVELNNRLYSSQTE
ncbi:dual specificity protein phosphatase 3-like isoform X2 [Mercenaria mercenaria]|uniref:dual specificity protein phosphatase 3-like isoform X2 n=1 Tax=Mercenaria mercenaria TaxID=6596 RepID=UPI00234F0655|nr:dual specificity protein phosphatase 3-like isoform X2 [Mercenaria mercenaria]